jgi:hypothetical protein
LLPLAVAVDARAATVLLRNALVCGKRMENEVFGFSFPVECSISEEGADGEVSYSRAAVRLDRMPIGRVFMDMDESGQLWPNSEEGDAVEPVVLTVDERADFGRRLVCLDDGCCGIAEGVVLQLN